MERERKTANSPGYNRQLPFVATAEENLEHAAPVPKLTRCKLNLSRKKRFRVARRRAAGRIRDRSLREESAPNVLRVVRARERVLPVAHLVIIGCIT